MKRALVPCTIAILALSAAAAWAGGEKTAAAPIAHRIKLVNSSGVTGAQDITPFFTVPKWVYFSDTTFSDTMLTSTRVWSGKPLFRVTPEHESRIDLDGPTTLTVISLMPFHRDGLGYQAKYNIIVRIDDQAPQSVALKTSRSNPLYTTRVPGWTFGLPDGFDLPLGPGKHSIFLKAAPGPYEFLYVVSQKTDDNEPVVPDN
jgi:hypothetical protein